MRKRTGNNLSGVKEIALRALKDIKAKKLFEDFGKNIGNFLSPLLKNFEANCLVVGRNISGAYSLLGPSFQTALKNHKVNIDITIYELMETADMAGCARLLNEEFWNKTEPIVSKI